MTEATSAVVYGSTLAWELMLPLDRSSSQTLRRQLETTLRDAITEGRLPPRVRLPSTRNLAKELGVSRGVVTDAYDQLAVQGFIRIRRGSAPRVAETVHEEPAIEPSSPEPEVRLDLRATTPNVGIFPRGVWLRALQHAVRNATDAELGYGDARGSHPLRTSLTARLNQARGTRAQVHNLHIVSGYTQALDLLMRTLVRSGARRIGLEDPCLYKQPIIANKAGLEIVPLPVDREGVQVDAIDKLDLGAVVLGPAHQFPTGAVLSPDRRGAIAEWASRTGAVIIEDDYDAEFRYDRKPIGTLQGLAPEQVAYVGTASKTLAPALRLGWVVTPSSLTDRLADTKWHADAGGPVIDQLALNHLLTTGAFDRHLRRSRLEYRRRRDALADALATRFPSTELLGAAAGLHLVLPLPPDTDEKRLSEVARARGVALETLGEMRLTTDVGQRGVVLGYGLLQPSKASRAVEEVAEIIEEATEAQGPA